MAKERMSAGVTPIRRSIDTEIPLARGLDESQASRALSAVIMDALENGWDITVTLNPRSDTEVAR